MKIKNEMILYKLKIFTILLAGKTLMKIKNEINFINLKIFTILFCWQNLNED